MPTPSWWLRLLHRIAPWYDEGEATQREMRTEHVRQRSIAARVAAERQLPQIEGRLARVRQDYRAADRRIGAADRRVGQ
jgi:hypothetical protein